MKFTHRRFVVDIDAMLCCSSFSSALILFSQPYPFPFKYFLVCFLSHCYRHQ